MTIVCFNSTGIISHSIRSCSYILFNFFSLKIRNKYRINKFSKNLARLYIGNILKYVFYLIFTLLKSIEQSAKLRHNYRYYILRTY